MSAERTTTAWWLNCILGFAMFWAWLLLYLSTLVHLSIPTAFAVHQLAGTSAQTLVGFLHAYDFVVALVFGLSAGVFLGRTNRSGALRAFGAFAVGYAAAFLTNEVFVASSLWGFVAPWQWGFVASALLGFYVHSWLRQRRRAP